MKFVFGLICLILFSGFHSIQSIAQTTNNNINLWAYDSIHIPKSDKRNSEKVPLIVAVVDDGFRLTHKELKDFVYRNPGEIPGNHVDDDRNNYPDDISGWDISDNDNDVSVPEGRDREFFHGTYISSIITKIANLYYGETASQRIKIMPVKVLSDNAGNTYLKDGYKGIRYAMENGADIICVAWSGGNPGADELKIIQEADQKGILIISSAGNFNEEKILYPALAPEVIAVAGVDMILQKEERSNYGMDVDISAPAKLVMGAHPEKDNAYIHDSGTSASAAMVAGCAAVIMSDNGNMTNEEVKEALLNSTTPFAGDFSAFGGKMGSGILNLENALDYISDSSDPGNHFSSLRSKGSIIIDHESILQKWDINPAGSYHGFYLEPDISGINKPGKHSLSILINDTVWSRYNLSNIPDQLFVPSSSFNIYVQSTSFKKKDVFRINYRGEPIDSSTLYCSGLKYLSNEKGSIDDGSGDNHYSNYCSCKWIITVPRGKRIKFTFDQIDTQANVDFVYLVDGKTAIPENFIAKFSGQNLPPVVVSQTNEVLVWFVTDNSSTGQGWHFHYEAIE